MFVINIRIIRNIFAAVSLVGVAAGVLFLIFSNKNEIDTNLYSNEFNRISYINLQGWDIEETPYSVQEIVIPDKFNDVYKDYNAVMQKQGWDLSDYRNKTVKEYTYLVKNYAGGEKDVYARIILQDNRIIGGDIFKMEPGGFIKPLK